VYAASGPSSARTGSEAGIPNVVVQLRNQFTDALIDQDLTDANGKYQFAGVGPGTYKIVELQPNGWVDGPDFIGSQGGNVGNDVLFNINLTNGVVGSGNNFGELPPVSTPTPTPTATPPGEETCLTNRPDLTMLEFHSGTLANLLTAGSGQFTDGTLIVNISSYTGHSFSWVSNVNVTSVFGRTATDGALYIYQPPSKGATGLEAGGAITNLSFCYNPPAATPTPSATPTATPTPTMPPTDVTFNGAGQGSSNGLMLALLVIGLASAALVALPRQLVRRPVRRRN
jgi:hypothetical protein